ncbi:MAG: hypothetical protein WAQ27_06540 [Candidatus Microsaccharimonas sp.]
MYFSDFDFKQASNSFILALFIYVGLPFIIMSSVNSGDFIVRLAAMLICSYGLYNYVLPKGRVLLRLMHGRKTVGTLHAGIKELIAKWDGTGEFRLNFLAAGTFMIVTPYGDEQFELRVFDNSAGPQYFDSYSLSPLGLQSLDSPPVTYGLLYKLRDEVQLRVKAGDRLYA